MSKRKSKMTPKQALWMMFMQLEVSAWQDGRDAPEDCPDMSPRTEECRDQLLQLIDALIAGDDDHYQRWVRQNLRWLESRGPRDFKEDAP